VALLDELAFGVPLALLFMGVEFALLAGAMLAGEGSIGGVGCELRDSWPALPTVPFISAFSASLLRTAISAFNFAHVRSISGSTTILAVKQNLRPWMNPSIIQLCTSNA
jgi:hypothetical protein